MREDRSTGMTPDQSRTSFEMMALMFDIRNLLRPRIKILQDIGLEEGMTILDYGCGPGGYLKPTMKFIGPKGRYHAADIHPSAEKHITNIAKVNGFDNVDFILTDCCTNLRSGSVDIAYLFDIYHDLPDPESIIKEMKRVLKKDGMLVINDHHLGMKGLKEDKSIRKHLLLEKENKYSLLFRKR